MRKLTILTLMALMIAIGSPLSAQAPPSLPIQGYLSNADGVPVDGMSQLTLTLYDDGGNVLHTDTRDVMVDNGAFSTTIGDANNPLDLSAFRDNSVVGLGVAIDGGEELSPRFQIATAPFAGFSQYAGDAMTLEGNAASDFARAGQIDFGDLQNVPSGVDDGDDDTLADLGCSAGETPSWDGSAWACATGSDTLSSLPCGTGQIAQWNGSAWTCAGLATVGTSGNFSDLNNIPAGLGDGDDDTTYNAGTGISLNGTTFSLDTVQLDNTYVNVGEANSITSAMIVNSTVTADDLAANSVGADEIQGGAVGTAELATGAVTTAKIANNAVGTNQIANGSVGNPDLENNAVTSAKIAAGAVETSDLADAAVTDAKISSVGSEKITWNITASSFTETCNGQTWRFVAMDSCTIVDSTAVTWLADCDEVGPGALCEYDNPTDCTQAGFDGNINNCGSFDLYMRLD